MAKRVMIDSVKDHLIVVILKLGSAKEMIKTLKDLYKFNNTSSPCIELSTTVCQMGRGGFVVSYFMKIT